MSRAASRFPVARVLDAAPFAPGGAENGGAPEGAQPGAAIAGDAEQEERWRRFEVLYAERARARQAEQTGSAKATATPGRAPSRDLREPSTPTGLTAVHVRSRRRWPLRLGAAALIAAVALAALIYAQRTNGGLAVAGLARFLPGATAEASARSAALSVEIEALEQRAIAVAATVARSESLARDAETRRDAALRDVALARQSLAAITADAEAEQERLTALSGRSGALTNEIDDLRARRDALAADGSAAMDAGTRQAAALAALATEIDGLAAHRDKLAGETTTLAGELQKRRDALAAVAAERSRADAALVAVERQIERAVARRNAAMAALSAAESALEQARREADARRETPEAAAAPDRPLAQPGPPVTAPQRTPRDAALVATALRGAAGLRDAPDAALAALERQLVEGVCVTEALDATLGVVNRQTALALIRRLPGC